MHSQVRIAICGHLPTARDYLLRQGVGTIHNYMDATQIVRETDYHMILIYAPQAEGLLNTAYTGASGAGVPIRLLNEPCCHSALVELRSMLRRIVNQMQNGSSDTVN